ncbi:MAG: diaminopimelate decarboxylase [Candidatus Omnitrophica bacterium CG07_land_8_20_14_0_80_42_15]|uniref:Diaminopimelate decarboxylase n=1 Tax=Candidatus Aquitaenariimonas noxiae TaxID=1974741 RepID=A0A2J0L3E3_9BACT|nr:MAG: diaminopimelate decarboxylase [Candidatus Omnitrophica bacterium CG07_land_8_20_14_0_80_42_15]
MHEFRYKGNELYCENVRVRDVADEVKTPFYLYSYKTLIDHYRKLKDAFKSAEPLICFSMKANSNLAILKALVKEGAGLDIVSGGELYKARKAGVEPQKIVYAGVGKKEEEIVEAIKANILFFNVESESELKLINRVASRKGRVVNIALRINPDIKPKTHDYITTGTKTTKFGISFDDARIIFQRQNKYGNVLINGLHVHIGSQITESKPFVAAIKRILNFIDTNALNIKWLNIGGGLGIIYADEKPQTAEEFARAVLPLIGERKFRLILEPGRFIVGNSGILVTKVLYTKKGANKDFVIVDAGMNDLIRPSIYGAYHEILSVTKPITYNLKPKTYDIVGPICESGDFFGKNRKLNEPAQGDFLAIMGAGAYGFSMSSNYNARPRVAEFMIIKGKLHKIRQAENYSDLVKKEIIPSVLR